MSATRNRSVDKARLRARLKAEGLTSIEAVLHRDEVASLDEIKERLGVASRSEVLRLMIAKVDPRTITTADAATLTKSAG